MICITHKNCIDGIASAWVVKQKYPDAEIYFCQYGDPVPFIPPNESVIITDFSFSREQLEWLHGRLEGRLTIYDHHKSAKEALQGLPYAYFDMKECGATLTWKYLFPHTRMPELLNYVRDRDLWKWELSNSREISAYLQLRVKTVEDFDCCVMSLQWDMIQDGKLILEYQETLIAKAVSAAKIERIDVYDVPCVNSTVLQSEIGERLLETYSEAQFVSIYFHPESDKKVYSLRSRGDFDVSEVAKKFGGGGHFSASSFSIRV